MQSERFTSDSSTEESGDNDTEVSLTFQSDDGEELELEYESSEDAPDSKTMGSPETGETKTYYRVEDGSSVESVRGDDDTDDDDSDDETDVDVEEVREQGEEVSGEESLERRLSELAWPQLQSVASQFGVSGTKDEIMTELVEQPYGEVDSAIASVKDDE